MKIAVFTESYEPIVNGVSVAVATLRDGLRSSGHEVYVFAPHFPTHNDDANGVFRFPSRVSRFAPGYPIPCPVAPKIREEFFRLRPDLVHTQTPFLLGEIGLRWARRSGVPIVSTNHTLYTEYAHYIPVVPKVLTRAVLVRRMRSYYSRCDVVVVPSMPVEKVLRGYGIRTRMEIIKSGVSVQCSNDDSRKLRSEFGIGDDAFLLLYVGRVAREKNLGLLLRAFKVVRKEHPKARLMIVGSGPYEEECKAIARSTRISDSVIFSGMLSHSNVDRAYHAADAFVFPSITETQGLVVCEALTAGLPCIAVRAAGTPEVVDDGVDGLLTGNSVEEFAGATCRVISDRGLREQLSRGALRNAERFSVEAMVEQFESFYASVIERNKK